MLGVIRLTLTKNVAHNVADVYAVRHVQETVDKQQVHLMKKLFNLKMGEDASVAVHINEFNMIVS